ncbi:hypothetical protein ACIQTN_29390 [Streptomyces werraensis]|uniref:hypothetical protein n=1 Tax=Streptomyces werraensis TaxID=68284 RepID=UPI00380E4DF7
MSIAGASPLGRPVDWYVIYDDGTAAHLQVVGEVEPVLGRPGRLVSEEEYGERMAQLRESSAEHVAALEAADVARQETDYQGLRAAGVPEDTARRMSGYEEGRRSA